MLETYLRPAYQKLLVDPLAEKMRRSGWLSPDLVTAFSCFFGVLSGVALYTHMPVFALFFLLFSGYLDTFDGTLARLQQRSSDFGTMLDILSDRVVEFAIIAGLYAINPASRGLSCLFLLGSFLLCITSFLTAGIFTQNTSDKSFHYSTGIIERAEAFGFFVLMILLPSWFNILAWVLTGLVLLTTVIRLCEFAELSR